MSDEPRDGQSDGSADRAASAGNPVPPATNDSPATDSPASPAFAADPSDHPGPAAVPPTVGEAPVEDTRTDGSRTDVSAPWERPQRWRRTGLDADRVDALLARLGDDDEPDSRRSRRRNNDDSDAVPASALIAALGAPGPVEPGTGAAADDTTTAAAPNDADPDDADPTSAGEAAPDGDQGANDGAPTGPTSGDLTTDDPTVGDPIPGVEATGDLPPGDETSDGRPAAPAAGEPAGDTGDEPADDTTEVSSAPKPDGAAAGTADGTDGDAHTGPLPRAGDNAADLAEASSIRAALDRRAGVGTAKDTPAATATPPAKSRAKAAAAGTTLVYGSNRPRRGRRGLLYAGRTVAALVALITLLGVGVEWKIKDRAEVAIQSNSVTAALNTTDPSISTARTTAVVRTNSAGVKTTVAAPPKTVYKPENILLLGSDTRAGANEAIGGADGETTSSQSDTLMVAHISGDREHVTVLSIPRDTIIPAPTNCHQWNASTDTYAKEVYATDPGQTFHITNTYAIGGPQCIVNVVQSLTGLGITRMIGIDFQGFQAMVSALGGVTVNICKPIVDTVLGNVAVNAGVQVVQGQQALNLVRARHVIGDTESDLARIRRQQVVLSAILRQVTQAGTLLNPGKLDGFLQAFSKNTFTQNVTLTDLVTLAGSLGTLDPAHVTFYTLPTVPSTTVDGALDVDRSKAAAVFDDLVNDLPLPGEVTTPAKPKPAATSTAPAPAPSLMLTVAPSKVALQLYNVSGRDNVAGMAQQELNAAGFSIDDTDLFRPARTQTATQVQFAPANRAAALTVAAAVPGSTLVVIPGLGNTVRLQLGSSFAGVVKTVAVGQQAPASLSTAISTGASIAPSTTAASTALSSVNAGAGTCV